MLWGLSVLLHRVCCCGNWEGGLLELLLGLLRLLRGGGGGGEAPRLRGRVVVLRLQEILGWCCWGRGVSCCGGEGMGVAATAA